MIRLFVIAAFAIIFCVAQVYIIHLYFDSFTIKKVSNITFLLIAFFLVVITKLLPSDANALTRTVVFVLSIGIIVFLTFSGTVSKKLYHIIYFSLIMLLSDLCLSFLVLHLTTIFAFFAGSLVMTLLSFVFNLLALFLSYIVIKLLIYFKVDVDSDMNHKEYVLLGIIPFSSLLFVCSVDLFESVNIFGCYLFLLIVNVCIMLLYYKVLRKNITEQKYLLIKAENEYYQNCLSAQRELIEFKHDLKNILIHLDVCLRNNQNEEARLQLARLIHIESDSYEQYSGCTPIDAILNYKLAICRQKHIKNKLDIQFPHDVDIHSVSIDVSAILGNLLDNAIEATLRLDEADKRRIGIAIKFADDKLIIRITNTCKAARVDFSTKMVSSEKERGRYGVGISSIKDRVDKSGGYYDFSCKEELFYALAVIPIS